MTKLNKNLYVVFIRMAAASSCLGIVPLDLCQLFRALFLAHGLGKGRGQWGPYLSYGFRNTLGPTSALMSESKWLALHSRELYSLLAWIKPARSVSCSLQEISLGNHVSWGSGTRDRTRSRKCPVLPCPPTSQEGRGLELELVTSGQ